MTKSEETKSKYQGIFVAACTPMKEDYSLDLPRIRTCIEYLVGGGLRTGEAVYVALGAGGEQMHLSIEERKAVAEAAVDASAGRLPVFVGISHQSTQASVELAQHAERIGADGLQVEPPWYFASTSDDAFEYFRAISESVSLGLTAYNTFWTCGFDMDMGFVERLAGLENVVGLKWSSSNDSELVAVLSAFKDRFNMVCNFHGAFVASSFILGARGYVSQAANFAPRTNLRILQALRAGEYEEATHLYMASEEVYNRALAEVIREGITGEGNFIKACMPLVGIPCGPARLPLRHPPAWFVDRVRRMIDSVGELRLAAS